MAELAPDQQLWNEAHDRGIILIPFRGGGPKEGYITAAIKNEDLAEAGRRFGLDTTKWEDVYALGIGFFIETSVPGYGTTRLESYQEALAAFEEHAPVVTWREPREEDIPEEGD